MLQTPTAVMGVRGTQFFVSSAPKKKNVWMCVNEGEVQVYFKENPNKFVSVKEGQGVVINSDNLPEVKNYEWTKKLNWKLEGSAEEIEDKTDIQGINYNLKDFVYE